VRLLALRPLLAYCTSLGWQWIWLWRSRWNVDWQGKPKFSEKTCPSTTFVHQKIPHDQTRVWTRAAAVGSRRLTAWAMAWPLNYVTTIGSLLEYGRKTELSFACRENTKHFLPFLNLLVFVFIFSRLIVTSHKLKFADFAMVTSPSTRKLSKWLTIRN
jgi:hypothetical protein